MKNLNKSLVYLMFVFTIITFCSCTITEDIGTFKNSLDSLSIKIGTPEFAALVHFEFVDAKTNDYIPGNITITLSGKNSTNIYNNIGKKLDSYNTVIGMLDLVVDPHNVDTATIKNKPIEFDLSASLSGYVGVTQKIFVNENKTKNIVIPLLKLDDAPSGVSIVQNTDFAFSSTDANITETVVETLNSGNQTVEISKGVELIDKLGNPVTGTVSCQVIYYDPTSVYAQKAIPGGLDVTAKLADASTSQISFVSAGMFNIFMSAGGNEVRFFENGGVKIKTNVPPALINPHTGYPVKEGDLIELWSLEENSGNWIFEKMDTIKSVNNVLFLEETIKHLSSWNWSFYSQSCSNGPKFSWIGNLSGTVKVKVSAKMENNNSPRIIYTNAKPNDPDYGELQIYNTPTSVPTLLTFTDANENNPLFTFSPSTLNISNLCDGESYNVTITEKQVDHIIVKTDMSLCARSNKNIVIKPSATIYFKPSIDRNWISEEMKNGIFSMSVNLGIEYDFFIMLGGNSGNARLKVEDVGNNMLKVTMTPTISFGSLFKKDQAFTYNLTKQDDNIVNLKYTFKLTDDVFNQLK